MENASEALYMVFAVLVFVLALTVAMNAFNQAKATSDVVLYQSDITNYYEYQGATGKESQNRIVGLETVIPTLYKYYKEENCTVLFRQANYDRTTGEYKQGTSVDPLYIYKTASRYTSSNGTYLWGEKDDSNPGQSTYDTLMQSKYNQLFSNGYNEKGNSLIFSFDLDEETSRHEPWTQPGQSPKEFIDKLLKGEAYIVKQTSGEYNISFRGPDVLNGGFINWYNNRIPKPEFVETIVEYKKNTTQSTVNSKEEDGYGQTGSRVADLTTDKNNRTDYKRIVIFTLIKE